LDYSTLDYSYNMITNQILDASSNHDVPFDIETFNSFSFGGDDTNTRDKLWVRLLIIHFLLKWWFDMG